MRIVIKYTTEELRKIQEYFPNLYYEKDEKKIKGELDFCAHYKDIGYDGISKWIIEHCNRNRSDCIEDVYSIEIDLKKACVFETDGRIEKLAKSLGKKSLDLHLNADRSCCLGILPPVNRLSKFVIEWVYPYFVWQAYYEKYHSVPPCGECPHSWSDAVNSRIIDEENNLRVLLGKQKAKPKGRKRNELCPCGSEKKYKKCCYTRDKKIDLEIRETEACLYYLKNHTTRESSRNDK